jgi:hypothetical protein
MDTHSMIFVTIGNLVSPSGSVNGDPLFDFPDHWQPRFSARFPLCWESEGADWPAPSHRLVRSSHATACTRGHLFLSLKVGYQDFGC